MVVAVGVPEMSRLGAVGFAPVEPALLTAKAPKPNASTDVATATMRRLRAMCT